MPHPLETLIRYHKMQLDGLRQQQAQLEQSKESLREAKERLNRQRLQEQDMADANPLFGSYFGGYAQRIKEQCTQIDGSIAEIDRRLDELGKEIANMFGELKKYEIAKEKRDEEERLALLAAEQRELDAVGARQKDENAA